MRKIQTEGYKKAISYYSALDIEILYHRRDFCVKQIAVSEGDCKLFYEKLLEMLNVVIKTKELNAVSDANYIRVQSAEPLSCAGTPTWHLLHLVGKCSHMKGFEPLVKACEDELRIRGIKDDEIERMKIL